MTHPWATTAEQRAGLLVAVITGGRPLLKQRPTARLLPALTAAGFPPPVWVLSERDAPGYEQDEHEQVIYPAGWAHEYARDHWMLPEPPEPGGFLGAFPGREWACREAERRGCWGVLQIDDNVRELRYVRDSIAAFNERHGGSALYADALTGLSLATNARMMGLQLSAVQPSSRDMQTLVRTGFPYSFFVERVGAGREPWLGPYEDDITHALQYGSRYDGATAAVMPVLTYFKDHGSRTGMRARYGATRSVQLQRLLPEAASIGLRASYSNGAGGPRVFHKMGPGAIRNPLTVQDRELYGRVKHRVESLMPDWWELHLAQNRRKTDRRIARQTGG